LSVFTKEEINNVPGNIQVLSRYSLPIENLQFTITGNKLTAKCKNPEDIFKVCITNDTGQVISNFSIVHRFEALLKCNPDPDQEKLDILLEQDYPDGEGVTELLTFIDHNWADEDDRNETGFSQSGYVKKSNETKDEVKDHEILAADEFNKISDEMLLKQAGELSGSNVKIAEFLSLISAGIITKTDNEFKESEEQKLLEDSEQKGEGEEISNAVKPKSSGRREKMAISRYFKKLRDHYNKRLNSFYETKALSVTPDEKMTIKVLSNILIALQLIQIYYGKKYSIAVEPEGSDEILEESYLQEGDLFDDCDSIKGFMIDVFGKFLLLSTAGMNLYDYEILNEKISFNRKQILIKAIFTTLNMTWRQSEIGYRDTILLNALYFITPDPENEYFLTVELREKIEEYKLNAKTVSSHFNDNFSYLFDKLIPQFVTWLNLFRDNKKKEQIITDTSEIKIGSIIFNSKIGFNLIYKTENSLHNPRMDFLRAGFEWNEEEEASLWEDITFTKRCVAFNV